MVTPASSLSSSALFQPIKVGAHQLQHRVVMAPTTRMRTPITTGVPTASMVEYFRQRATSGGLLIAEATVISPDQGAYPGAAGIWSDEQVVGWKKVTEVVHAKGAVMFDQLWHIGRAASPNWMHARKQPVGPSAIAAKGNNLFDGGPYVVPHALTIPEIKDIIQDFVKAAHNAIRAGFDGVELHASSGYLLDQFINTSSNQRTDAYGGSIENRARLVLETVDAVVDAVGEERTAVRFGPFMGFQSMEDESPYETWGYLTEQLQARHPNLAYLHFVEPRDTYAPPDDKTKELVTLDPFRAIWKGPFISADGYTNNLKLAEDTANRTGNLISFGRGYIANPDLVLRLKHGWPLNPYDRSTFYYGGDKGFTDYPTYSAEADATGDKQGAVVDPTQA